jgi:hypothetical protein
VTENLPNDDVYPFNREKVEIVVHPTHENGGHGVMRDRVTGKETQFWQDLAYGEYLEQRRKLQPQARSAWCIGLPTPRPRKAPLLLTAATPTPDPDPPSAANTSAPPDPIVPHAPKSQPQRTPDAPATSEGSKNKTDINSEDREVAPDLDSGMSTSAERAADLEFLLERQKALTAELHRQVVELTAKNDRKMRPSLRPNAHQRNE